jgi:uncharacterized membrane protein
MDANTSEWLNLFFRWIHVFAGVTWIGLLYFFNWVNGPMIAALDADTKKKVIPELLPRALYWFRWGAAFTWLTGILLLGIIYYMTDGLLVADGVEMSKGVGSAVGFGLLLVAWAAYDFLWKGPLSKNEKVGAGVSFILVVAVAFALTRIFHGRAMYIHVGALFGTLMAANVWMRIWPNQRRIIKATVEGAAPDGSWAAMAKLRSKHNTYMSVPLLFLMVSNHFSTGVGSPFNWVILAGVVALGWLLVQHCYKKSGSAAPKFY